MAYDLDYYKRYKKQIERQIADRKKSNQSIQKQIDRLQAAYDKLKRIKSSNANCADDVRNRVKPKNLSENLKWRGNTKKQYDDLVKNELKNASKEFYDSIDAMLDEVGTALSNKKGELDSGSSILNGLNRTWNWVTGTIRNWVN